VLIRAAAGNVASRAVAERAGFRHVGVDRAGERLRDGTVHDFVRYDLLAAELPHTR
jgi:RimJ/RimL family protein N-acetyltransferase